jgi:TnsA endonuclease-like protein
MGRYPKRFDAKLLARYLKEGRGTGEGHLYNPWIHIYDLPSKGLSSIVPGWKTGGREHHLLSTLELSFFYLAEWSNKIVDIREQFPLLSRDQKRSPLEETLAIAAERNICHPQDRETEHPLVLTTDFLLTLEMDGKRVYHARTIKEVQDLANRRIIEKFEIERRYWLAHEVDWGMVTERDLPMTVVKNIDLLHQSYFLPQFVERERLIDIACVLTTMVQERPAFSLADVAKSCDLRIGVSRGESLAVAYYLMASRQWGIDIQKRIDPAMPLYLQSVSLHASVGGLSVGL